jgi:acetyl esterase/lipase
MRAAFSRQLAHDEAALRKGRSRAAGDPPRSLYKQFTVDVGQAGDHRTFTVRPGHDGPVRGQILYLHGGGYVNPPAFLHWWFIARLVKTLGVACTVPLYPRAPEHQCDEGIAFASEAYRRLVSSPAELRVRPSKREGGYISEREQPQAGGRLGGRGLILRKTCAGQSFGDRP